MAVYQVSDSSVVQTAAYDYRSYGERIDLNTAAEKVTEEFTGKELDEETFLNNFGVRM